MPLMRGFQIWSIYSENELGSEATCKDSLQVRKQLVRIPYKFAEKETG